MNAIFSITSPRLTGLHLFSPPGSSVTGPKPEQGFSITSFQPKPVNSLTELLINTLNNGPRVSLDDPLKLRSLSLDPRRLSAAELFLVEPSSRMLGDTPKLTLDSSNRADGVMDTNRVQNDVSKFVNPNTQLTFAKQSGTDQREQKYQDKSQPKYQEWQERQFKQEKPSLVEKLLKLVLSAVK